ncbi:hypothetical protein FQN60_005122 [Etheostoma spectabile]|uniref:Uncharacterized protein n=1 Tax=Etheostoma spectabile TaxID=54343 RepID=A0A5J5DM63_9PERO|nr:hypothetical protein FQN60_005122 [Etheostoma spectabile]
MTVVTFKISLSRQYLYNLCQKTAQLIKSCLTLCR